MTLYRTLAAIQLLKIRKLEHSSLQFCDQNNEKAGGKTKRRDKLPRQFLRNETGRLRAKALRQGITQSRALVEYRQYINLG